MLLIDLVVSEDSDLPIPLLQLIHPVVRDPVDDFHVRMAFFGYDASVMRVSRSCDNVNVPAEFCHAPHEPMRPGSISARVEGQTVVQKVDDAVWDGGKILRNLGKRDRPETVLMQGKKPFQTRYLVLDFL